MRLRLSSRTRGMSPAEAAAHWVVRHDARTMSVAEKSEFDEWHDDPVHADTFRRASGALALFAVDYSGDANLRALRQAALEAAPVPQRRYRLWAGGAIAASIAAFFAFQQPTASPVPGARAPVSLAVEDNERKAGEQSIEYHTAIGERRTVRLADGSLVTMNTRTKLAIIFSERRRLIRLIRGQALFDVRHDANRPFTVEAADRQVTALGTVFEVRIDPGRVNVVLFRGRVVVDHMPDASGSYDGARIPPTILKPGQQFNAELGAPQQVVAVDVDQQLLWRSGFVEFDNEPLGRAVAEINRYSSRPIILSGDGVAALHVSGLYRTGSPDQFLDAIQAILPVEAKATGQGGIELSLASHAVQ